MKPTLTLLTTLLLAPLAALHAADSPWLQPPQHLGAAKTAHAVTNRAFQGIPSMAVSPKGRLWVTWYAGVTPGEDHNNYAVLSTSGDDGNTWKEVLVVDPDAGGPVRAYDPELWMAPDGKLRWFWTQAIGHEGSIAGVWCLEIETPESGTPKWSGPIRVTDGVMMCKPIVLSTGEWVLPTSTWRATDNSARMVVSTDKGKTWSVRGGCNVPVDVRSFDEHMFVERKDGNIWLLARTKYGIGESVSTDRGKTWPELTPSSIPHPSARFFITRLKSSNLLLVKHGPVTERTGRSHLMASISKDDGKTWGGGLLLDERTGVSYPDGQQTPDGLIRIIYDYSRTGDRHILMATFREKDAAAGNDVSGAVRLRQLVSQASGGQEKPKTAPKAAPITTPEHKPSACVSRVFPANPPNAGILFVNHSKNKRSGHLGHALVQYAPGKILAFYPNCSSDNGGHSAVGWMEFKRSEDGGKTWGRRQELTFTKALFNKHNGRTAMAEKAVVTDKGEIVLFYLICDVSKNALWQPYWEPLVSKSTDAGKTWSEPKPVCSSRGRIYDAKYHNGEIRVLHFANDAEKDWRGNAKEHVYELHVSTDGGETFTKRSDLPFTTNRRGYGAVGLLGKGELIAYIYNSANESMLDYAISTDGGKTWPKVGTSTVSRKIRNPQFSAFGGKYYLHGRSGAYGDGSGHMILYMSEDGVMWDDGVYLRMRTAGAGAYSNSIVVDSPDGSGRQRLLIQASHAYEDSKTNVLHWWLE